ncbi:MAG: DUF6440 family protein [Oscillospiraceae bacterium]
MNKKRFEVIYSQKSFMEEIRIIRDTETGVAYLSNQNGYSGGICPLLNSEGKPMIYIDYIDENTINKN